jgi:hypothetical protein
MSMTVEWMVGADDQWCDLDSLDLTVPYFDKISGVYVVWFEPNDKGDPGRVVCIGHGVLRCKLGNLREDPVVARHASRHMKVTWAEVDHHHLVGVETYLIGVLNPIHSERHPSVVQTIVNLPGK